MIDRLLTTGVYGKVEDQFFRQLIDAQVQVFCDIRKRRGVRGSRYAFVNSTYLQKALAERKIAYRYCPELAPTKEIREAQYAADIQAGVLKSTRQELGAEFKRRYTQEILATFDSRRFADSFDSNERNIVLFCVEAVHEACHRSLVAEKLHEDLGVPVEHL